MWSCTCKFTFNLPVLYLGVLRKRGLAYQKRGIFVTKADFFVKKNAGLISSKYADLPVKCTSGYKYLYNHCFESHYLFPNLKSWLDLLKNIDDDKDGRMWCIELHNRRCTETFYSIVLFSFPVWRNLDIICMLNSDRIQRFHSKCLSWRFFYNFWYYISMRLCLLSKYCPLYIHIHHVSNSVYLFHK